jgi:hypothetical protein
MRLTMTGLALIAIVLSGCATRFPAPQDGLEFADGLDAATLFERTLAAHGGDMREYPGDLNLAMTGEWGRAIVRIQPLVTDADFRISAEERFRPSEQLYVVRHEGPEGSKTIRRQGREIAVWYNGEPVEDPAVLRASAMTTDAFELFHFGPSFVKHRAVSMRRLADRREDGVDYRLVWVRLQPGFGEAEEDQLVLWIDPETDLLFRVHLTLNGFETTQGAHVDTTFLDYQQLGPFRLPTRFSERVRGPIRIQAHDWWITGSDVDRGWQSDEVAGPELAGRAAAPAGSVARSQD